MNATKTPGKTRYQGYLHIHGGEHLCCDKGHTATLAATKCILRKVRRFTALTNMPKGHEYPSHGYWSVKVVR